MKVYKEVEPIEFDFWSGALYTIDRIKSENKEEEFNALVEEVFPDGADETELNDFVSFDDEYIFECLGIEDDE